MVGAAEDLPFADQSFHAVLMRAVPEHVADSTQALNEIGRVLRPGGTVLVAIPFMQGNHPSPFDRRRYTREGLSAELERHGFTTRARR